MNFNHPIPLGRTGLNVGRLGVASSFGAPARAIEAAFERGCNYFTWGNFIRGRSAAMQAAIRNIVQKGRRDDLVLALVSYAHNAFLTEYFLQKDLKAAGVEYADVLILGYYPKRPSDSVLDGALHLKARGLIRHIGLTTHNRNLIAQLQKEDVVDVFHVRYNAAHRGAAKDVFPRLAEDNRPGIVSFTATCWRNLLKPGKMPKGQAPPTAADCYRFVLSNPAVDVCMTGVKNEAQMQANLKALAAGPLTEEEFERMRIIGDYVYGR